MRKIIAAIAIAAGLFGAGGVAASTASASPQPAPQVFYHT
jgi:hypothetical protein